MKGPSRRLRPSSSGYRRLEIPITDIDAVRPEVGPHGPPAASADVDPATEAAVTMTPVTTVMAMAVTEAMSATVHAVSTAMPTTVAATSRSRGDGGSGQSEGCDSCERNLTKHYLHSPFARRDCLMRSSDALQTEIVRNIFLNRCSGNADEYWSS